MVQWLRLCAPNAGGLDSIPGQGTRSRRPQRRSKIPHAATRTWNSQISKIFKKNQMEITELKKNLIGEILKFTG